MEDWQNIFAYVVFSAGAFLLALILAIFCFRQERRRNNSTAESIIDAERCHEDLVNRIDFNMTGPSSLHRTSCQREVQVVPPTVCGSSPAGLPMDRLYPASSPRRSDHWVGEESTDSSCLRDGHIYSISEMLEQHMDVPSPSKSSSSTLPKREEEELTKDLFSVGDLNYRMSWAPTDQLSPPENLGNTMKNFKNVNDEFSVLNGTETSCDCDDIYYVTIDIKRTSCDNVERSV